MAAGKYIKLTESEKRALQETVEETFGESRISYGAFISYLCEQHNGGSHE